MIRRAIVGLSLSLLSASALQAQGLPTCRVRVVKSARTEAVAKNVFRQVESWANAPERGTRLVPTINDADVLLEFTDYRPRTLADGSLGEQYWFIARRLSEASSQRAIYRFGYLTGLDRKTQAHVAKRLSLVLGDVCLGYLPKMASGR
jgi:hypothetical protein